jgi:hypothetical protein
MNEQQALLKLVDEFADAMKRRLINKSYKSGWDDPAYHNSNIPLEQMRSNLEEGDMVDVACVAAFVWRGQSEPCGQSEVELGDASNLELGTSISRGHGTMGAGFDA